MSMTQPTVKALPPINLMKWVEANKHLMKPPVSNKYLYDGEDFFIMLINGPNARNDFHQTNSEEFFLQLKGDIVVRIIEDGRIKDVVVREGETFFVPGNVPHSPTRPPNTLGLVVERKRPAGETEHIQWYCDKCHTLVEDMEFDCKDIVEHFSQAMEGFWADAERSTCRKCGTRVSKPKAIKRIVFEPTVVIERERSDVDDLKGRFHHAMLGIYDAATQLKPPYYPTYFKRMVHEMGGVAAARALLAKREVSEGFHELYLRGKRLDLSVEFLVLQDPWQSLFDDGERAIARDRLKSIGYQSGE